MASVEFKGLSGLKQSIALIYGELPDSIKEAIRDTGKSVMKAERDRMKDVFHEPTPFALNSLFQTGPKSRGKGSDFGTAVRLKSPAYGESAQTEKRYMGVQIFGGKRKDKMSESYFKSVGILPSGMQTVPGKGFKLNKYGNITGGAMQSLMKSVSSYNRGKMKARAGTFVVNEEGIFKVGRLDWTPMLHFVAPPSYSPRFNYHEVGVKTFNDDWRGMYNQALDRALKVGK